MNKLEFSKLKNKEDMILAFNQLKDDYRQLFAINEDLQKENERLNNVINELEKWLKEENYKNEDFWCINSVEVLNKLRELKEKVGDDNDD